MKTFHVIVEENENNEELDPINIVLILVYGITISLTTENAQQNTQNNTAVKNYIAPQNSLTNQQKDTTVATSNISQTGSDEKIIFIRIILVISLYKEIKTQKIEIIEIFPNLKTFSF